MASNSTYKALREWKNGNADALKICRKKREQGKWNRTKALANRKTKIRFAVLEMAPKEFRVMEFHRAVEKYKKSDEFKQAMDLFERFHVPHSRAKEALIKAFAEGFKK